MYSHFWTPLVFALFFGSTSHPVWGMNSRDYNYMIFENFVLNEKIFELEVQSVQNLIAYKTYLTNLKDDMSKLFYAKKSSKPLVDCNDCRNETSKYQVMTIAKLFELKSFALESLKTLDEVREIRDNFYQVLGDPNENMMGALRALLMLQETYQLDVLEMAAGRVSYKGKVFQGDGRLGAADLRDLSSAAYHEKWYDNAIWFLKGAKTMYAADPTNEDYPERFGENLEVMTDSLAKLQNGLIVKKKERVGEDYKLLPYLVDEKTLEKKKTQPKSFKKIDFWSRRETDKGHLISGDKKEDGFRRICRGELKGAFKGNYTQPRQPYCFLLHQNDPFLKLAPLKLEEYLIQPYRVVFHDFLSESEIQWMLEYSKPRMSRSRGISVSNYEGNKHEFRNGKRGRTVHKTVQVWFRDIKFNEEAVMDLSTNFTKPMKDEYGYTIINPVMYKITRRMEQATRMNVSSRFSSTDYQTTNYGLGGLCETHLDPYGYLDGMIVPADRATLFMSGDMIATFMAWLEDVPAGGGTGYDFPGAEMLVEPKRGAAAFWIDLYASGYRDNVASHGGCPVLIGSKWILNKWIHFFDQWKTYPCHLDKTAKIKPFSGFFDSVSL